MSLEHVYRKAMALNTIADMGQREAAAQSFFEKRNQLDPPEQFNWGAEIFEGLHVRERGDQPALAWTDLATDAECRFTYRELAANGKKFLNFVHPEAVEQGDDPDMLTPIVPETCFASLAGIKGGLVSVTAATMTEREIQYRFEAYRPDVIVAFEELTDFVDDALLKAACQPKAKIVLGPKAGWGPYTQTMGKRRKRTRSLWDGTMSCPAFFLLPAPPGFPNGSDTAPGPIRSGTSPPPSLRAWPPATSITA